MWKSDVYHLLQKRNVGVHVEVRERSRHQNVRGLICWNSLYNSYDPSKKRAITSLSNINRLIFVRGSVFLKKSELKFFNICTGIWSFRRLERRIYTTNRASSSSSYTGITTHYRFLAFLVILFHSALSLHWFLHRLISHYLHIFFDICNPSLPWSPSNSCTYRFSL